MKNFKIALFFLIFPFLLYAQDKIDLFILAGQSNAQGWTGDALEYPQDGQEFDKSILLNWTFYGNESSKGEWITMQPQKGRYPSGHFGPEVSFGRELKKSGYNPAIFKYCLGSSGLARDWKKPNSGGIYDNMIKDLTVAIYKLKRKGYRINVRGFVWIQGESDAGIEKDALEYQANLKRMIYHLRTQVLQEPHLKIVLGVDEQHAYVKQRPVVVEGQKKIACDDKNIIYTTMYGLPKADETHLTPSGLVEHGKRIFMAFEKLERGVSVPDNSSQSGFSEH